MASPTLRSALKDGIGEAIVVCTMFEPFEFQKRSLWTHKEVDLALYLVVGLVLQVGDAETFPPALGFKSLDPFVQIQQARSMFHSRKGGWR